MKAYLVIYKDILGATRIVEVEASGISSVYKNLKKALPDLREIINAEAVEHNKRLNLGKYE